MDPQVISPGDGAIDEQILGLLQHHRRLTFLTLAESLPLYTGQPFPMRGPGRVCFVIEARTVGGLTLGFQHTPGER